MKASEPEWYNQRQVDSQEKYQVPYQVHATKCQLQ